MRPSKDPEQNLYNASWDRVVSEGTLDHQYGDMDTFVGLIWKTPNLDNLRCIAVT